MSELEPIKPQSVDFTKIEPAEKGTYYSQEDIVTAMNLIPEIVENDFSLKRLHFIAVLRRDIYNETGIIVSIKCEGDGVRVLTDSEAVEYNYKRFVAGLKTMNAAMVRQAAIDESNLTPEEQRKNNTLLNNESIIMTSIKKSAKKKKMLGIAEHLS